MKEQPQNQALGASETTCFFFLHPDFVSGECRRRRLDAKRDAHDA